MQKNGTVLTTARRAAIVVEIVFVLEGCFLGGCSDYEIPLPNGYSVVSPRGGAYCIGKEAGSGGKDLVVGMNVRQYAVAEDVVTGHVTHSGLQGPPSQGWGREGYFVLNTKTGELQDGLGEEQWKEALRALGVESPPVLRKPSRWNRG